MSEIISEIMSEIMRRRGGGEAAARTGQRGEERARAGERRVGVLLGEDRRGGRQVNSQTDSQPVLRDRV